MIRYSQRVDCTTVLGPSERAVIWVYGCCFNCEGCIASSYNHGSFTTASPEELAQWFVETGRTHLTISGGEPFLQAEELCRMLKIIREKVDAGVIVYSGFTLEELLKKAETEPETKLFLDEIDILIDGRYEKDLDTNQPYRGSENQRIIPLTERYKNDIDPYYSANDGRKIEIKIQKDKTVMVGVPSAEQSNLWKRFKSLGSPQQNI